MSKIAFTFRENGEATISNNNSLEEDLIEEQETSDGSLPPIVAHIEYETDNDAREAALDVLLGCHALEWNSDLSTLERIAMAIWQAGLDYGRQQANGGLKISDI